MQTAKEGQTVWLQLQWIQTSSANINHFIMEQGARFFKELIV